MADPLPTASYHGPKSHEFTPNMALSPFCSTFAQKTPSFPSCCVLAGKDTLLPCSHGSFLPEVNLSFLWAKALSSGRGEDGQRFPASSQQLARGKAGDGLGGAALSESRASQRRTNAFLLVIYTGTGPSASPWPRLRYGFD